MAQRQAGAKEVGRKRQSASQAQDLQPLVAQKAYELFEQSGWIEGRDLENWLEAERLIRTTRSTQG